MADLQPTPPTPRWVKRFALVGMLFVILALILLANGHGPWQHDGGAVR